MNPSNLLSKIFEGSDIAHGRTIITGEVTDKGKHKSKSWTEHRSPERQDWEDHIAGRLGIGISPIRSDSHVRWGAIDVDIYNMSNEDLNKEIQEMDLPLVLCRSKSNGAHLYLFVSDWIPAKQMIAKLDALAASLGLGSCEIFPKQAKISRHDSSAPDFGNWINLPYHGTERRALDPNNIELTSIDEFANYVAFKTVPVEFLDKMHIAGQNDTLEDGPPCLNILYGKKCQDGYRNILLCNTAVYLKKRFPEDWENKLEQCNQKLHPPLERREVDVIISSYKKTDYQYQCSTNPLKEYCNSTACRSCQYGVGDNSILSNNRSLTKIDTTPPVWYLDIESSDGSTHRISLSTDDLQNPRLFQKRCMDEINVIPPIPKPKDWHQQIQALLEHVSIVEVPEELTPKGMLGEFLRDYLDQRSTANELHEVSSGAVYKDLKNYYFKYTKFLDYLTARRFTELQRNQITAILKETYGANSCVKKISDEGISKSLRMWVIPISWQNTEEVIMEQQEDVF